MVSLLIRAPEGNASLSCYWHLLACNTVNTGKKRPELISLWLKLSKSVRNWTHFPDSWEPLHLMNGMKLLAPSAVSDAIQTDIINHEKDFIPLVLLRHAKVSQCREMIWLPKMCWQRFIPEEAWHLGIIQQVPVDHLVPVIRFCLMSGGVPCDSVNELYPRSLYILALLERVSWSFRKSAKTNLIADYKRKQL